jgi:hypothetical protein
MKITVEATAALLIQMTVFAILCLGLLSYFQPADKDTFHNGAVTALTAYIIARFAESEFTRYWKRRQEKRKDF